MAAVETQEATRAFETWLLQYLSRTPDIKSSALLLASYMLRNRMLSTASTVMFAYLMSAQDTILQDGTNGSLPRLQFASKSQQTYGFNGDRSSIGHKIKAPPSFVHERKA